MSIVKSNCAIYEVNQNGEFANIALREWKNDTPGRASYGGELLINSSKGDFNHTWLSLPRPLPEFLVDLKAENFLISTLGFQARVFCLESTKLKLNAHIAKLFAQGELTSSQAELVLNNFDTEVKRIEGLSGRDVYTAAITATEQTPDVVAAIQEETRELVFAEVLFLQGTVPNPQGMAFWNELWPELRDALKAEIAQNAEAAAVPA